MNKMNKYMKLNEKERENYHKGISEYPFAKEVETGDTRFCPPEENDGIKDITYPKSKYDPNLDKKKACLIAAQAAVCGDRPLNYGKPEANFNRIAALWNTWNMVRHAGPYTGTDVAIMMDLVKTARLANNPAHSDSWIDKAGYAACGYDIAAKEG
jgi:Domain of unknown function (DUF6378)